MVHARTLDLNALLLGALDPARARELAAELHGSAALQARWARLTQARTPSPTPTALPGWRVPPPGLRRPGPTLLAEQQATLGGVRPGEVRHLQITGVPEVAARALVVLRLDAEQRWALVFPKEREDWIPAARLLITLDTLELRVTVGDTEGTQRWAALFPPLEPVPDWDAPLEQRWAPLQEASARGALPSVSWELQVQR